MNDLLSKKRKSSSSLLFAAGFLIVFGAVAFGKEFGSLFQEKPSEPLPQTSLPKPPPLANQKPAEIPEGGIEISPEGEITIPDEVLQSAPGGSPGGMVRTDVGIGGIAHAGDPIPGMDQGDPNAPVDDRTFVEPSETPAEVKALIAQMEEQAKLPPQELPEDLKRQLSQPPPELPEDLKAQLSAPPPEIPEDIKRALLEPPKILSIEEVNKFPEPVNSAAAGPSATPTSGTP